MSNLNRSRTLLFSLRIFLLLYSFGVCFPAFAKWNKPRLVLVLMIDQFRADYLTRFQKRWLPAKGKDGKVGGFQFLMSQSAYFPQGEYELLQSVTAAGHATILTGAYPYMSGIPLNHWYDSSLKKGVYCTEDPETSLVGGSGILTGMGMSPKNLNASTLGDELKNAGFPSRVVSIALKDRASILMGGHRADVAVWFDSKTFQWISSKYYLSDSGLPKWVKGLNQSIQSKVGKKFDWSASADDKKATGYSDSNGFSYSFQIGNADALASPLGIEMTVDAAEAALEELKLGSQKEETDLLAMSFSSHDFVGHAHGPNSREMEEMAFAEDRQLSRLFNFLEKQLPGGLKEVLIVLSGDHGAPSSPDWLKARKIDAGRINEAEIQDRLEKWLTQKYGKGSNQERWVPYVESLNVYFNRGLVRSKDLEMAQVEREAKDLLAQTPGVFSILTSSDYFQQKVPVGLAGKQALHSYYPGRSGNLILVPRPFFTLAGHHDKPGSTQHHTGYSYDRTVPILLLGEYFRPGLYGTRAAVVDIAPTLAFLLGITPPNLSEGRVLSEALREIRL